MALKRETLEEQIQKRSAERTRERIKKFKAKINEALYELLGRRINGMAPALPDDARKVLLIMASDDHRKGWPRQLWQDEEHRVTSEVMQTMDELQRVLLARGVDVDIAEFEAPAENEEVEK